MERFNADVINIQKAVLCPVILILYAPFMLLGTFILTYINAWSMGWILVVITVVVLSLILISITWVATSLRRLKSLTNGSRSSAAGLSLAGSRSIFVALILLIGCSWPNNPHSFDSN